MSEDGNRILPGMSGYVRGLHGSLYVLHVQAILHNMGALPKEREEISPGESSPGRIGKLTQEGSGLIRGNIKKILYV